MVYGSGFKLEYTGESCVQKKNVRLNEMFFAEWICLSAW